MSYTRVFGDQTLPPGDYQFVEHTFTGTLNLYWPLSCPPGEKATASITHLNGSSTPQVVLADASSLPPGYDLLLVNTGAVNLPLYGSDEVTLIATLEPSKKYYLYLEEASSVGTWDLVEYGTGTSQAQASQLAGAGLAATAGQKLAGNVPTIPLSSDYLASESDRAKLLVATDGTGKITLPLLSSLTPTGYYLYFRNFSSSAVTLSPQGSDEIDGTISKDFLPGEGAIIMASDFGWMAVGYGKDIEFTFTEFIVNAAGPNPTLTATEVSGRMIRVSGVATENKVITLPTVPGIYFVRADGGLGAYTATFTTGSGSVYALSANQATVLYCDGTNILSSVTTSSTPSISLVDGSSLGPSLSWAVNPTTGFYRASSHTLGFSANGVAIGTFSSNGWSGPAAINAGTITGITDLAVADGGTGASTAENARANLGLGNVDNTSDASKPVSTATQTALNLKANATVNLIAGNGLTGGGTLGADCTFTMGTPSTLTTATTNSVTTTSHTHAVTFPVTSVAGKTGAVSLVRADALAFPMSVTATGISKTLMAGELCAVTAAGLTITLPASPTAGDTVGISIVGAITNTVTGRNGQNIMSLAEDMTIDRGNVTVTLCFVDATRGWRII